ncbi:MFS transporter [Rhodoferax koreense]|uniref:MFS transporter n=1 Tax=Rhodoferax koreensis TaxID=1842727 RepID=A0A1P8K251_9BURK|nr:MFS transporter [Rhodoferax koreense]APW40066.1 MFS transporter [Rhodoferax koreense]
MSAPSPPLSSSEPAIAPFSRRIPLIVAAAFFMETLDSTIVTTALPAIAKSFNATTLSLSLSISAYLVALAVFVPTAGWASDRFGARRLFAGAIALFTLSSLLCALSPNLWSFIAARTLQGVAAAFMSPVGRLVVLRSTPKQRLIEAIGLITWPGLIGPVLGPPLGGLISTYASWHWIFLINIPLGIAGVWMVLRHVPDEVTGRRTPFDVRGFGLTALALAALVHGLALLGEAQGAASTALVWLTAACMSGALAIRHALRHPTPMLDLRAARVPTFAISMLTAGMMARIAISATPFLLPLMFQIGFGLDAFRAGLMLLVYMGGNLAMKSATTPVLRRFGFRRVLTLNGLLCAAAMAACGLLTPGLSLAVIYPVLFIAGMSRSMHFTTVSSLAFADIAADQRAGASTISAMAQQVAATLGVAFAVLALAFFQNLRGASALSLADFQRALLAGAALMALAALYSLRLAPDAGIEVSGKG